MTWAKRSDLLVGEIPLHAIDVERYLEAALNEMNIWLGQVYTLPLPDEETLPDHQVALLRKIHADMTSAKIILSMSVGSEQRDLHAYGERLLAESRMDLQKLGTSIQITGATAPTTLGAEDRTPSINQGGPTDTALTESPFDTYERYVHQPDSYTHVQY